MEDLDNAKKTIEDLKQKWQPGLQDIIKKINESFGLFFQDIGCAGEVHLSRLLKISQIFFLQRRMKILTNML